MPEWLKNTVLKRPLGSVMLPAIITMIVLSYATLSLVQIQAAGLAEAANHAEKLKSEHLFLAGIEFSYALLNNGQSPATNGDRTLGSGNINVTANPSTESVTVKGEVPKAKKQGTANMSFSKSCIVIDDNYVFLFGNAFGDIQNIHIRKTCHNKFIINKMYVTWTNSNLAQKVTKIDLDSAIYYDAFHDPPTGSPVGGANSGVLIDINDITITDANEHTFGYVRLQYPENGAPPPGTVFTIRLDFQDGSSKTKD